MMYNVNTDNNINIIILEQMVMGIFVGCIGYLSSYNVMLSLISKDDNIWIEVAKFISILLFAYFVSCFSYVF